MAASFVQINFPVGTTAAGTTKAVAYTTANNTAGHLLVATAIWQGSTTATASVSDSTNGAWTPVGSSLATDAASSTRSQVFYLPNCAGGVKPTVTLTISTSVAYIELGILEYSGCLTASPVDTSNAATGASSVASVNLTTTTPDTLLLGVQFESASATNGAGFTLRGSNADGNPIIEKLDQVATGAVTVQFATSNSTWGASAVAFKTTAGGGGTTVKQLAVLGVG